jgi:hypothetical protein
MPNAHVDGGDDNGGSTPSSMPLVFAGISAPASTAHAKGAQVAP